MFSRLRLHDSGHWPSRSDDYGGFLILRAPPVYFRRFEFVLLGVFLLVNARHFSKGERSPKNSYSAFGYKTYSFQFLGWSVWLLYAE